MIRLLNGNVKVALTLTLVDSWLLLTNFVHHHVSWLLFNYHRFKLRLGRCWRRCLPMRFAIRTINILGDFFKPFVALRELPLPLLIVVQFEVRGELNFLL